MREKRYRSPNLDLSKEWLEQELKHKTTAQLSKEIGCHVETLRRHIKQHGIERSRHSHLINEHYFKTWSGNMAYILGFTYADGSINTKLHHNKLAFQLQRKDEEVLAFIKNELQPNRYIYHYDKYDKRTGRTYKTSVIDFSSKILITDLISIGIIPNKTYGQHPLPNIPDEYWWDFVRGWFDGDGSISITKDKRKINCNISCNILSSLYTARERISYGYISEYHNPPRLSFHSYSDRDNFYKSIYNGGFCLRRKFNKFQEIMNG